MKKILILSIAGMLAMASPGWAAGETLLIKTKGLVCDFCARSLEKTFMKQEEVAGVSVDLTTKLVTVRLKEGGVLDDAVVRKLVTDSGYTVHSIEIERK